MQIIPNLPHSGQLSETAVQLRPESNTPAMIEPGTIHQHLPKATEIPVLSHRLAAVKTEMSQRKDGTRQLTLTLAGAITILRIPVFQMRIKNSILPHQQ